MAEPSAPPWFAAAAVDQQPPPSDRCPICLEFWQPGESWLTLRPCFHAYHEVCAKDLRLKWEAESGQCPVCRQPAVALTPISVLLREAAYLKDQKMNQQCCEKLLEVIALDEEHLDANHTLGDIYFHEGDFQKAQPYWEAALRQGFGSASFNLGVLHYKQGDMEKAKQYFMDAHNKGSAMATYNLGVLHAKQGDVEMAMQYYMEARSKGSAQATCNLGLLHEKQGSVEMAMQYYIEAHEEGNAAATCNLGWLHTMKGDVEMAKQYYTDAHNKGHVDAMFRLGILHTEKGEFVQAERYFLETLSHGGNSEAAVWLGFVNEKTRKMHQAREWYLEGVAKGHVSGSLCLGYLAIRDKEEHIAEEHFTKVVQSDNAWTLLELGLLRHRCRKADEAELCYAAAIRHRCIPAKICLATLFMTTGRQQQAVEQLPKRRSQLHYAQQRLLSLKKWWHEPAMCALIGGYAYILQGSMQDAKALYAEARAGGLEVPPELFAPPPGFTALAEEARPLGALEHPREPVVGPASSSSASSSAANHSKSPRAPEAPLRMATRREKPETRAPSHLHAAKDPVPDDAAPSRQEPVGGECSSSNLPDSGSSTFALPSALRMLSLLQLAVGAGVSVEMVMEGMGSENDSAGSQHGNVGQESQDHAQSLPAAWLREEGEPSISSSSPRGDCGQEVLAVLAALLGSAAAARHGVGDEAQPNESVDDKASQEGGTALLRNATRSDVVPPVDHQTPGVAPRGASSASSSSSFSTSLPRGSEDVLNDERLAWRLTLAQIEELEVERNKRLLERPPLELVEEQAARYQEIRNQQDPVLVALQSAEQRDKENADVAGRVLKQRLSLVAEETELSLPEEKLYLLTFNPNKSKRDEHHELMWSAPSLQPLLRELEEAGLPRELPAPRFLDNGELAPGEVRWKGVKMLVPVHMYQKAKDRLRECQKRLWPRFVVVSESTKALVLESMGPLGRRHREQLLWDEVPKFQMPGVNFPPKRKLKTKVLNSTEAGSRYRNPRCVVAQWDHDSTRTDGFSPAAAEP